LEDIVARVPEEKLSPELSLERLCQRFEIPGDSEGLK